MKIIRGPRVTQIRIYPQEAIPVKQFAIQSNILKLKEMFTFTEDVQIPFPLWDHSTPNIVEFKNGSINIDNYKILIYRLAFEDRRIVIDAETSSGNIDKIFKAVENEIEGIDPNEYFKKGSSLIKADETTCIVKLNIDYLDLLSKQLAGFMKKSIKKYSDNAISNVALKNLSFEVTYEQTEEFKEKNVTLVPKVVTIEPRAMTSESEKLYFTLSPFDSDTHNKLLSDFESKFTATFNN